MGSFEKLGSTDPSNERVAEHATRERFDELTSDIDPTILGEILTRLKDGDINDLPSDLQAMVAKMKRQASENGPLH
ncbi:hypothetical protein KC906_01075, partial [Candidatus Kaiserbacteria bacterium]|nr:hypothetical protein [Candidatus Kaiserbacteria bacterium]MCB9812091.1 hypothetical protein [Candidatus Nomurabacteria bacterium]